MFARQKRLMWFFLMLTTHMCFADGLLGNWKIGVFNSEAAGGSGNSFLKIMAVLNEDLDMHVSYFDAIADLTNYQAVVFSCVMSVGKQPENWKEQLRAYVKNGGGVVLIHDSCGRIHAMSPPIFPEVVDATDRLLRKAGVKASAVAPNHPLAENVTEVSFQLDQYPELKTGPQGATVMRAETGAPIAIAGDFGKGRVVGLGTIPGWTTSDPAYPENRLLINSVYWAAGAPMLAERQAAVSGAEMMRVMRRELILLKRRLVVLERQDEANRRASGNARQLRLPE